ncbi:hypothetical protein FDP41_003805 [Naegleria fowleri]|uniref:SMP-LTD domain-containing protein n=1 Tax=Naegleria fowleri TaxID=5763 RepID=A0A6A5BR06_NAEFO|nr:uncharacterized protein FDP41_003805 [Naegleria fowleri]KAF0977152.1 hypothetical protein FDP41_003805 [Naegleria fowleri]CAG4717049.1 unnamed protein product [Naegleria fowleri]
MSLQFDWKLLTPEVNKKLKDQLNSTLEVLVFSRKKYARNSSVSTSMSSSLNESVRDEENNLVMNQEEEGSSSSMLRSNRNGLEISPTQSLSYLIIDSLDLGTTAPNIQIKDIQQAPDEKSFMQRAKYYENKIYGRLYPAQKQRTAQDHRPNVDLSKTYSTPPSTPTQQNPIITMTATHDDNVSVSSVATSGFLMPSPGFLTSLNRKNLLGPGHPMHSPLAYNSLMMASGHYYYPSPISATMSDVFSQTTMDNTSTRFSPGTNNLSSLRKAPQKTHICSIGTVYKLATNENKPRRDLIAQTKRRASWWKERLQNLENKRDVNNFIPPVQILNNGSDKLSTTPIDLRDENFVKQHLIDPGFLLTGKRNGKGGGVKFTGHFSYSGNASIKIVSEVRINMPIPGFVTIPIEIEISKFVFDGDLTIMYYHNPTSNLKQNSPQDKVLIYFENPVLPSFEADETKLPQFSDQKLMANYIVKSTGEYSPLKEFNVTVRVGSSLSREQLPLPGEDKILEDKTEISNFIKELVHKVVKDLLLYPNVFSHWIDISGQSQATNDK